MLELDSDRWRELRHAYGSAEDIPPLLRDLHLAPVRSEGSGVEPWFTLWSALCHQSDVYPASYAALPHIVASADRRGPSDRAEYLALAGLIESMRHRPSSPEMPADLDAAYTEALRAAVPLTLDALVAESDASWFRALLAALASFRGFPALGAAVAELQPEAFCPSCEAVFATPGYDLFE